MPTARVQAGLLPLLQHVNHRAVKAGVPVKVISELVQQSHDRDHE